jgi:hypothetical protein
MSGLSFEAFEPARHALRKELYFLLEDIFDPANKERDGY